MRRSPTAALPCLVLMCALALMAVPATAAAVQRGATYAGSKSKGYPVVLQLSGDRKRIVGVIEMWDAPCTAGSDFPFGGRLKSGITLARSGRFDAPRRLQFSDSGGSLIVFRETVTGRIRGGTATGTWSVNLQQFDQAGTLVNTCVVDYRFKARSQQRRVFGGRTAQDQPLALQLARSSRAARI